MKKLLTIVLSALAFAICSCSFSCSLAYFSRAVLAFFKIPSYSDCNLVKSDIVELYVSVTNFIDAIISSTFLLNSILASLDFLVQSSLKNG